MYKICKQKKQKRSWDPKGWVLNSRSTGEGKETELALWGLDILRMKTGCWRHRRRALGMGTKQETENTVWLRQTLSYSCCLKTFHNLSVNCDVWVFRFYVEFQALECCAVFHYNNLPAEMVAARPACSLRRLQNVLLKWLPMLAI